MTLGEHLPAVRFGRSFRVPEPPVEGFLQRPHTDERSESARTAEHVLSVRQTDVPC
jgi:hypothetical protein